MNINRNNYEEFFISYLDGSLSGRELVELENFLEENPDLREELEGLGSVVLMPEDKDFPFKNELKKIDLSLPVTTENFDEFCIAEIEGDLSPEQHILFSRFLDEHPEKRSILEAYRSARLTPHKDVSFPAKHDLKKNVFHVYKREIYTAVAVAAGIALLAGTYFGFVERNINQLTNVAVTTHEETSVDSVATGKPGSSKTTKEATGTKEEEITPVPVKPSPRKSISKGFSFKVEMPTASNETPEKSDVRVNEKEILSRVEIDPSKVNQAGMPLPSVSRDKLKPVNILIPGKQRKLPVTQPDYATIEQFAKQKFSNLVFGKENSEEITLWNVVTAGLDKVNTLTGSNMKLERETNQEGQTRALKFDSKLLKINAPVNKDE